MELSELTPAQLRQAASIKERIQESEAELQLILGSEPPAAARTSGKELHWTQTPEGAARMAKIRARRWKNPGKAAGNAKAAATNHGTAKVRWTQTPDGKARMAKLMRARWRKRRGG